VVGYRWVCGGGIYGVNSWSVVVNERNAGRDTDTYQPFGGEMTVVSKQDDRLPQKELDETDM